MIEHVEERLSAEQPGYDGDTPIPIDTYFDDETPRTLRRCQCANRRFPSWVTLEDCNTAIVQTGVESGSEIIDIGGVEITITNYVNIVYGYWDAATDEVVYFDEPKEVSV